MLDLLAVMRWQKIRFRQYAMQKDHVYVHRLQTFISDLFLL